MNGNVNVDLDALHVIRLIESEEILAALASLQCQNAKVLEIGGGTGFQAAYLAQHGVCVTSVDLDTSNYRAHQVFPVISYDGHRLPFADSSFDVAISSNVLEHVFDLDGMWMEIHRVLRPGGVCIHILPTAAWRAWTTLVGNYKVMRALGIDLCRSIPNVCDALRHMRAAYMQICFGPPRHGERGTSWSEIWLFSRYSWRREFAKGGFELLKHYNAGLFYTGHQLFGNRLSVARRRSLAPFLGSACRIYVLASKK